jgi:hypothetical protein
MFGVSEQSLGYSVSVGTAAADKLQTRLLPKMSVCKCHTLMVSEVSVLDFDQETNR